MVSNDYKPGENKFTGKIFKVTGKMAPTAAVNRTDGVITKVDLQAPGADTVDLVDGGSRGDLVTAGDDGCLYATQTDRVLKVTNVDGTCTRGSGGSGGATPSSGLGNGLVPTRFAVLDARARSAKACPAKRRIRVRISFPPGHVRVARVFLGARRVQTVRGRALRRAVTLRLLPVKAFRVTVRATLRSGRRVARQTRYSGCGRRVLSRKRLRVHRR